MTVSQKSSVWLIPVCACGRERRSTRAGAEASSGHDGQTPGCHSRSPTLRDLWVDDAAKIGTRRRRRTIRGHMASPRRPSMISVDGTSGVVGLRAAGLSGAEGGAPPPHESAVNPESYP
jgi:hypothetical protein